MKATLQMEAVKTPTNVVRMPQGDNEKNATMSSRKIVLFSVLGLTTVLVTAAIVLTSLYFGAHLLQNESLSADIRTHKGAHHQAIPVTEDKEAVIENDKLTLFRDYKKKLAVYMFSGKDVCYVANFNETNTSKVTNIHFNESSVLQTDTSVTDYRITDMKMSVDILSDKGQKMCEGKQLVWIQQMSNQDWPRSRSRHRRSCCCPGCNADFCDCCCAAGFIV